MKRVILRFEREPSQVVSVLTLSDSWAGSGLVGIVVTLHVAHASESYDKGSVILIDYFINTKTRLGYVAL